MRKKILALGLAALISFTFVQCSKEDERKFSCNKEAHEYAVLHMEENQNISRDSLVQLEKQLQFAVFRSLTPENKKRIFNEKIDVLLATEDLSLDEQEHLIALRDYYDDDIYGQDEGIAHPFLDSWEAYARLDLNWDDERFETFVCIWMTVNELNNVISVPMSSSSDCTCKSIWYCRLQGCDLNVVCEETRDGCGLTGSMPCKGLCPEDKLTIANPGN